MSADLINVFGGRQYNEQAESMRMQAVADSLQAEATSRAYLEREDQQRRQARALMGEQAAATGESGFAMQGSAKDIALQSMMNAEMDALNIRYEGEMKRRGLKYQSATSMYNAGRAKKAAKLSAISTGLSFFNLRETICRAFLSTNSKYRLLNRLE